MLSQVVPINIDVTVQLRVSGCCHCQFMVWNISYTFKYRL